MRKRQGRRAKTVNRIAITVMVKRDNEGDYSYTVGGIEIDDFITLHEIAVEKFRQSELIEVVNAKFDALHAEAFDEELAKQ